MFQELLLSITLLKANSVIVVVSNLHKIATGKLLILNTFWSQESTFYRVNVYAFTASMSINSNVVLGLRLNE